MPTSAARIDERAPNRGARRGNAFHLTKLNAVYGGDLESFNRLLRQNNLPEITRPGVKM